MMQMATEQVLERTGKLAKVEGMKDIQIRRDMSEEEKNKTKELTVKKSKTKMQEQTEKFFWRAVDLKVKK